MGNRLFFSVFLLPLLASFAWAQPLPTAEDSSRHFLEFIRSQAAQLRAKDQAPQTRSEWEARREELRRDLQKAWGSFPEKPCPLDPKTLGVIQKDGYRIEKLLLQTMPGVWMTANAYVPDKPGKHPALLAVHGHWRGARLDPVVQRRCIGPAKLGYFVLAVDAFGAGERGLGPKLGEYHGEMVAATLFPVGKPLSGLQVYENMRAVDYLASRPEVDASKIAITGASGGGNQSMYAGAWDERLGAVVPVCSVGTYQAYLGPACCMCEVVPGALRFTEEWGILSLTAPRGLMVVNATKDGIQFSVGEAKKSLAQTEKVYQLYGKPDNVRHTVFDWRHDYSKEMRQALYGWLAWNLKGEGDGTPIPEPDIQTEDLETLRCFPGDSRPEDWKTIPRFAAEEGRKLLENRVLPQSVGAWEGEAKRSRKVLVETVFGGFPPNEKAAPTVTRNLAGERHIDFQPEPGIRLSAIEWFPKSSQGKKLAILLDLEGKKKAMENPLAQALLGDGWKLFTLDLRATGPLAWPKDKVGRAPDHTTAEWSLWIGRPLLGQWTNDLRRLLDTVSEIDGGLPAQVAIVGQGPAGVVALAVAAVDPRISHVAAVDSLASYISEVPYQGQRLGLMAPAILRDIGDIAHLAALSAPRRVVLAGSVTGGGEKLTLAEQKTTFSFTERVAKLLGSGQELRILESPSPDTVIQAMR